MGEKSPSTDEPAARSVDPETILDVLGDGTARTVFAATEKPRSAGEVAEESGVSLSTVYRKLDALVEVGLVTGRVVPADGTQVTRYRRAVAGVTVRTADGGFDVELAGRGSTPRRRTGTAVAASD